MPTYVYTARDNNSGNRVSSELEATDETDATKLLTDRGLSPISITMKRESTSPLGSFSKRVPTRARILFSRQLSTLINAGLPLVQSLRTVGDQTHNQNLKLIIEQIITSIESGSSFSEAVSKYPRVFDDVFVSLVAAGETSGTLDKSLERLANQQEKDAEILSKVRGAMVYPAIVMIVLILVVIFMMTAVLPAVQNVYNGIPGAKLPILTRVLLTVAHILINYWYIIIFGLVIVVVLFTWWFRSPGGVSALDEAKMRAWPVNELFMKLYMARFARTAATLVGSGVPMIKMLNTVAQAVGNVHIAKSINNATEKVKGGTSLSESLKGDPHFLQLVPDMIHTGEQSGALEDMLSRLADYYEKEVDNQIKTISTLVEPALMIVVGIIALIIVAAILLPIYGLVGKNLTGL